MGARSGRAQPRSTTVEPRGYPSWWSRDVVLLDGRSVFVRPVLPDDVVELRRAVEQADLETLRSRFLGARPPRTDREFERLTVLDHDRRSAVLALTADGRGVGIARYDAATGTDVAEVAVAVDPQWRRVGLATALIRLLAAGAVRNGIHHFTAETFETNLDVRELFADTGLPYTTTSSAAGVVTIKIALPMDAADLP